jgi:MinD-like ATPase involved in chromosome partitioning or flagellar assembly
MNTYAAIKVLAEGDTSLPLFAAVNLASPVEAAEVHARLAQACQRFLGLRMQLAGNMPADLQVAAAARSKRPFVAAAGDCEAARGLEQMAEQLAATTVESSPHFLQNQFNPHAPVGR